MQSIRLNPTELDAMIGLPWVAVALYVLAIRPRMDYATGTVGVAPRVSWQALSECCRVHGAPGIKGEVLSRWSLRRAALQLVRAGLLAIHSDSNARELVFECVAADRDSSGRNKAARKPHESRTPREAPATEGKQIHQDRQSRTAPKPKAAQHPGSGSLSLTTTTHATVASSRDEQGNGEELNSGAGAEHPRGEAARQPLDWSLASRLTAAQREGVGRICLPEERGQAILDELIGHLRSGTVRNPVAYARAIAQAASEQGDRWNPTWAEQIASERVSGALARESADRQAAERAAEAAQRGAAMTDEQIEQLPEGIRRRLMGRRQAQEGGANGRG